MLSGLSPPVLVSISTIIKFYHLIVEPNSVTISAVHKAQRSRVE